ncbi:glutathione S-transferase zeta class-like isoform X7 [Macadamia integrifolia]|uniref:glutathione S-transferase zeta class-like isoform X7 n=1 Tax=Macadamia integrifolia TaxID=60698 RepID=UPI001C4E865B|nr:glutathione S-transferase zeta class-like isoform X7 [Macadamia integrifolia]
MDPNSQEVCGSSHSSASTKLLLYSYWQSPCSWRVWFALNLKEFERLNPLHYVPVLVDGDVVVGDSFAILLAASIVSSSIHPRHLMSLLEYIEEKAGPGVRLLWTENHMGKGFDGLEKLLKEFNGRYATGDEVYMADVFLAPQICIAIRRFNLDMSKFPTLSRIYEAYKVLPAFQASLPERQPDAIVQ